MGGAAAEDAIAVAAAVAGTAAGTRAGECVCYTVMYTDRLNVGFLNFRTPPPECDD